VTPDPERVAATLKVGDPIRYKAREYVPLHPDCPTCACGEYRVVLGEDGKPIWLERSATEMDVHARAYWLREARKKGHKSFTHGDLRIRVS
jgi:hypothetical protein